MPQKLPILIIGAGMAGITAAVEAAEADVPVVLIEKEPWIGGHAIKMNRYFPKMCPPYCGMEINFRRIKDNPLIDYHVSTEMKSFLKTEDGFEVELLTQPEYVNSNCTACGDCSNVCPVEVPDPFNQNMSKLKAIALPHALAFPEKFHIHRNSCEAGCKRCDEACSYNAIDLNAEAFCSNLKVGSILLATGWESFDMSHVPEYHFGQHPNIITNLMMERLSALHELKALQPKSISFIQCAGSRDEKYLPYCSGVCCSATLKQALDAVELLPEVQINIHYIDLRVDGRNEDFLKKVEDHPRINLIKGKAIACKPVEGGIAISSEHIDSGKKVDTIADLVVLAAGLIPSQQVIEGLIYRDRTYTEETKLPDGVFFAGSALTPMDISSSNKNATGAVVQCLTVNQK